MFLIEDSEPMNLRSSSNEKTITEKQNSETKLKTSLIYIKKRINKMRDLYAIRVSISFSLFSCPSIII